MPSRNILKTDVPEAYYHIYARGSNKQPIFLNEYDYKVFFNLLKRYLSREPAYDGSGRQYPHLQKELELLCYCLMPNHFHLLVYQTQYKAMATLMRGVMTSYSKYFNDAYGRSGPLLESRYKASMITNEAYLLHISRYIHLNPEDWETYPYSSIQSYIGSEREEWLQINRMMEFFPGALAYKRFVADYEDHKKMLEKTKHKLADN